MERQRGGVRWRLMTGGILVAVLVTLIASALVRGRGDGGLSRGLDRLATLPAPAGFLLDLDAARLAASTHPELGAADPQVQVVTVKARQFASSEGAHPRAAAAWSLTLPAGDEAAHARACTEIQAELARLNSVLGGTADTVGVRAECLKRTPGGEASDSVLPGAGIAGHYSWTASRYAASDGQVDLRLTVVWS